MNQETMKNVETLGELVSKYGFLVVFSIVMLLIVLSIAVTFINRMSASMKLKYEAEAKKMNIENDHLEKQREAEIDQQRKMFDLVTNVQTEQVSQLRDISSVMALMKQELQTDTMAINRNNLAIDELNKSVNDIILKYEVIASTLVNVDHKTEETDKKIEELVDSISVVKDLLEKINETLNNKSE